MLSKKTIIVDDRVDILLVVSRLLEGKGYDTMIFSNPIQATQYVIKNLEQVNFIITDYEMPEQDGLCMMREIHGYKLIPFVLFSGALSKVKDSYSVSQIDRLGKPDQLKELLRVVEQYHPDLKSSL